MTTQTAFLGLVEDAWYAETKGELDLTEDPDPDTLELVSSLERFSREFVNLDAGEQFRPGVGGEPVTITEVTDEEIARRIAVSLETMMWGVS